MSRLHKKLKIILAINSILIVVFIISSFLPYFSKWYQYGGIIYYFGYNHLIFGGWEGLLFITASMNQIRYQRIRKAFIFGLIGCISIMINQFFLIFSSGNIGILKGIKA
ncbi:hypothetical protein ES705_49135 [subsurface metagenome]